MAKNKVLVFGDDTRGFLTIVRALGRRGIAVHVAPTDFRSAALRSRYIAAVHPLPALIDNGAAWVRAVEELLRAEHFDLVIPCTDRALLPLHVHRERLEGLARLAIPAEGQIDALFDKLHTREIAASLGVNVAPAIDPRQPIDAGEIFRRLGAPVVVKPRRSVDVGALHRQEQVYIAGTPEELEVAVARRPQGSYFIESFFRGTGLGVSVLADEGRIVQAFQHHRIHEAARGGSSAYRVSAPLSPELLCACEKIVEHLGYTGVAMFEFRRNFATGDWILLEVNARPWGSMPLPVALGVDFPYAWYRLLVDRTLLARQSYRTGIHGRNLDLDISFAAKTAAEATGWLDRAGFLIGWVAGFARVLAGREKLDELVVDDPAPGIAELRSLALRAGRQVWLRLPGQRLVRRAVARRRLRLALRATIHAGRAPSIAFVCYGNICRSAFAERAMVKALAPFGGRVTVRSAGTYQVDGRASPCEAMTAARRRSIDLGTHRSRCVTAELLASASVLIAFDQSNVEALKAQFPTIPCPIILLGSLIGTIDRKGEISDPYGREPAVFDRVFAAIEQGVAVLRGCIVDIIAVKSPT